MTSLKIQISAASIAADAAISTSSSAIQPR
jgi:hypothetical protein